MILELLREIKEEGIRYCMWEMGRRGLKYNMARKICLMSIAYTEGIVFEALYKAHKEMELFEEKSNYWGE